MKKIFFIIVVFSFITANADFPDVKEIWKKHGFTDKDNTVQTKGRMETANELVMQGEFSKALKIYEELLNKDLNSSHLHNAIGFCFEKMGEEENAMLFYSKAAKLTPVDPDSFNNLAYLTAKRANGPENVLPAVSLIESALKYSKNNINYLKTRLFIFEKAGLIEKWEEYALEIAEKYPNINEINIKLGNLYINKKEYGKAKIYLNKALPDQEALELLGYIPVENPQNNNIDKEVVVSSNEEKPTEISPDLSQKRQFEKDFGFLLSKEEKPSSEKVENISGTQPATLRVDIGLSPVSKIAQVSDANFDRGIINYEEGYYDNALKHFEEYARQEELNKNYIDTLSRAYKYIGLIYTKMGRFDNNIWGKIAFIDECVMVEKIRKHLETSNLEQAKKILLDMLKANSFQDLENFITLKLSQLDGYLTKKENFEHYQKLKFLVPDNLNTNVDKRAVEYFTEGYKRVMENKISAAEKYFEMAISNSPSYYIAHYNMAVLKIKQENYKDGLYYLNNAKNYAPVSDKLYTDIRKLYNRLILYL